MQHALQDRARNRTIHMLLLALHCLPKLLHQSLNGHWQPPGCECSGDWRTMGRARWFSLYFRAPEKILPLG
eukprot:1583428-Prorocentrum_lima.AAC.1